MTKYVTVTTISQFKMRYVIPVDRLQEFNNKIPYEKEWAEELVIDNLLEDFSQEHLGEVVIDSREISEEEMLNIFDDENNYLESWSMEHKLEWVKNLVKKT